MSAETENLMADLFGHIDDDLPMLLGRVAMASALLEHDLAVLAMSVQDREQDIYDSQSASVNIAVCRRRFKYFTEPWQKDATTTALRHIAAVRKQLDVRNDLLHRVWSRPSGSTWGGYKGRRGNPDRRVVDRGWNLAPAELDAALQSMLEVLLKGRDVLPVITALPRLPAPFSNGVWPVKGAG